MNGTSKKGVNIMGFLYLITALLDLVICLLFCGRLHSPQQILGLGLQSSVLSVGEFVLF